MALTKVDQTMVSEQVFGRRNLLINGDMRIAQRATAYSGATGTDYYTVDRWQFIASSAGTWTVSQSTTVPTGEGFAYSHKFDCTTADASLGAGDYLLLGQKIEGINLQHLKYGTSSAEKLTLSFWVRSAKTGTYVVEYRNANSGGARTQSQSYTISAADTWEKKTITIDGDTASTFESTTNSELEIYLWLAAGSNFTSGTLNTSWGSDTTANRAVGVVNLADSTSNDWYITGVQLEVGNNATPFEHLSQGESLALCERYLEVCRSGDDGYCGVWGADLNTTTNVWTGWQFRQEKRAKPTFSLANSCAWQKGGTAENVYEGKSHINFQSNDYFYFGGNAEGTAGMLAEAEL
jgi:hypothetical protein